MATVTTIASQQTSPVDSNDPAEKGVSSRRLKKREIDRRCQRQARERTKSRIAYLEGLVEDFRRQDSSGQVATLMKQLQDVELERDLMAKTLRDIQKAMDAHKPARESEERMVPRLSVSNPMMLDEDVDQKPSLQSLDDDSGPRPSVAYSGDAYEFATYSPPLIANPQPGASGADSDENLPSSARGVSQSPSTQLVAIPPSRYNENYKAPSQCCSCNQSHLRHFPPRKPGAKSQWKGRYWLYANEVLSERFDWDKSITAASSVVSDDVPVRALLEGWDAVEKRGPLHPSWQILRRIDETLFFGCPKIERLAILRAMHTLIQFHTEASNERYQKLPPWYLRRPSQNMPHSYAIDFFAWPGVRERFIFDEHAYCSNEFWHLFCSSIRILWPYEFRDCYTREISSGLYKISPHFDQKLSDIKCWTMGPDFLNKFPEMYSDVPSFNQVPKQVRGDGIGGSATATAAAAAAAAAAANNAKAQRKLKSAATATPKRTYQVDENDQEAEAQPPPPVRMHSLGRSQSYAQPMQPPQGQQQQQPVDLTQQQLPFAQPYIPAMQFPANQYGVQEFHPAMALDAFAYGTMNDSDFTNMYHPEDLDGYPNITF